MLTPKDRKRLAQILGMLGSAHDGERASAALHANKLLRELGVTWHELLNDTGSYQAGYDQGFFDAAAQSLQVVKAQEVELGQLRQQVRAGGGSWQDATGGVQNAAMECLASGYHWTGWEKQFLEDMQFRHTISEKQNSILTKLYAKMNYHRRK